MTNTRDLIVKLKEVREERNLSYNDILKLMEKNNDFLSKSTISRVFAEGSEEMSFRYEETIRPIANALLDIENIDSGDNGLQALKSLLKYRDQQIEDLEQQIEQLKSDLDKEKIKYFEKMAEEREQIKSSIEYFLEESSQKNKWISTLLDKYIE